MYIKIAASILASCLFAQAQDRQLKPGEREIYADAVKDIGAAAFPKAIADLDAWAMKFPDSDYRDDRAALYVQSYAASGQAAKALDAAAPLLARDLAQVFPGPNGQAFTVRLLFNAAWAITQLATPTPRQLAAGEKAARELLNYDTPVPGVTAEQWAEARSGMKDKAALALLCIAMLPGIQAMAKQPPDCAAAESAYTKALTDYPEKSAVSYELAKALTCEAKTDPDKSLPALYEFERAATLDATLGDARNDPKKIRDFADGLYVRIHGSAEGLDDLKAQVKLSPLPPPGFKIKTAAEVEDEREKQFEHDHPQLALWRKIKAALDAPDGIRYFEAEMKDATLPPLAGTLVEARPACRPRELLVTVESTQPEIALRLDKPLAGTPQTNVPIEFEGVPLAFAKEPFLLTVDTKTEDIRGLQLTPCSSRR